MTLSRFLPKLDNAGRRLILSEILGEPVSVKMAKARLEGARCEALIKERSAEGERERTSTLSERRSLIERESAIDASQQGGDDV